nr:MAG TPA: hypothetical protein [Caudoviricetes sp.]
MGVVLSYAQVMFRFEGLSRNKHINTIISNFQVFLLCLNSIRSNNEKI